MRHLVTAGLLLAALIHWLPLLGVLGAERLASLYGLPVAEPQLVLLLRHRAVLFGIVAALLSAAVWVPALQPAALLAGGVSVLSFLVLAALAGPLNGRLQRVVVADLLALAALAAAALGWWWTMRTGSAA